MKALLLATVALGACSQGSDVSERPKEVVAASTTTAEPKAGPSDGPIFDSIGELTQPDEVQAELRGGRVADPSKWQASFYTRSAGGSCTASIVGDRILLTAAHCVANGAAMMLRKGGATYRAMCEHAPGYGSGGQYAATADYALCAIERSVPGVPAERVNTDSNKLKVGKELLLTGFGCTTDQGTGGNDGVYRIGESKIKALPSGANNDITVTGGAGLCFGDSGGPAFLGSEDGPRVQVSVNSRVQNRSRTGTELGPESYLSSLTSAAGTAFLRDWSRRNGLRICGLDPQATTCRS